jgi:hypothetical protein
VHLLEELIGACAFPSRFALRARSLVFFSGIVSPLW